jgi:DNA-binding SARP family transcriptional activator
VLEFRLLGPVELVVDGEPVPVGPPKRRAVLAALLVDAGRPVSVETLIDRVWGEAPPHEARSTLYSHVARLRRLLADVGTEREVLAGRRGAYVLDVDEDSVDMHRMRRLIRLVRQPGTAARQQVELLREALAMWRGEPLNDVPGQWSEQEREALVQQRIAALRSWGSLELDLGNCDVVVEQIGAAVVRYPLAESLIAVQLRALYMNGRTAEALSRYSDVRQSFVDELGVEPGPELRDVHAALLSGDLPRERPVRLARHASRPQQLPADVHAFTGRVAELDALDALLTEADGEPTAVIISAVSGMAGVGKTALAVRWAHRVRDRFPDGQLFVDLHGYDQEQPVTAADALARFLLALGVPNDDIPVEVEDRAVRYRTEVAGRRMLVVLDNASAVAQIRPLLPGGSSCVVVVTSRDRLPGLIAVNGARRLGLDLLPETDALALLRRLIGPRAEADPQAARALAERCAFLPLALRVAAELAASRPTIALAKLVAELRDGQRRLDLLETAADPRAAVRVVFSWSLRHLSPETARIFRLLGLHPGPDVDPYAVAALTDTAVDRARTALDQLLRAHLVQPSGPGRYGMHDLLSAYAAGMTVAEDSAAERRRALTRLFDYYLAAAGAAAQTLYPAEAHQQPPTPKPANPLPDLTHADAARAWLEAELPALVAVAEQTAQRGWPSHAVRLSAVLYRHLDGHSVDALAIHGHAHHAASRAGDQAGEAQAKLGLGITNLRMGRYGPAACHLEGALALYLHTGDRNGEARALTNIGIIETRLGRHEPALGHYRQALGLFGQTGNRTGQARALNNLAIGEQLLGRYDAAASHVRHALALHLQSGDRTGQAYALTNLGDIEHLLGHYGAAVEHLHQAVVLFRELVNPHGEASALDHLGTVHIRFGRHGKAVKFHRQALALARRMGYQDIEASALNALGEAAYASARSVDALHHHGEALTVALDIGARNLQARAHAGLGRACQAVGDLYRSRAHIEQALALYVDLGAPEADDARAHLAALPAPPSGDSRRPAPGQFDRAVHRQASR